MSDMREETAADISGNPIQAAFRAWRQLNVPVVSAMAELNTRLIDQMARASNDWNGFVTRRLDEDISASKRLMECRTPQDVFSVYADFLARAQSQYLAEIQYFTRLNQRFADEAARLVRESLEESGRASTH